MFSRIYRFWALALLCLSLSANGSLWAGYLEVSPFVGYNFFESSQNLKNSLIYGGRLGYNFSRHFGIEGSLGFINSSVDDKTLTVFREGQYRSPMDNVDLAFYHLDAVYHFLPERKFNPFIVAGFGGAHYSPEISNKNIKAFDLGVGAKYWVADHIALRLDLRDYVVSEAFQTRDIQENYHNINATVGVVFAFGSHSKSEPAPAVMVEPEPETPVIVEAAEPEFVEHVKAIAAEPRVEEKIVVLAFEDVHFDFDKSTLSQEARDILKRSIQVLKNNPKTEVRIAGYSSASGARDYNQELSERRAKAVEDFLISEGLVTPERLSIIGYGEREPAEYEAAPKNLYSKAAKANMRVLFEIVVK